VPPPPIVTQQNGDDPNKPAPPMDIPPVVTTGDTGGKKSGRGVKVIATVLSVMLLLGAIGIGVYLTQQPQDIREKAACGSGCGNAPDPLPPYVGTPATVGTFDQAGKLVIYYAILEAGGGRDITIRHKGTDYKIDLGNLGSGQRKEVLTNIDLSVGDSITIVNIEEYGNSPQACAPIQGPPYLAIGWMGVNGDLTCGSGLPGPPSQCIPMGIDDVSSHISWAEGLGRPITDKQCWGDWKEWPGDYDFNDFFMMFAVEPAAPPTPVSCNDTCTQNSDCETGLTCSSGSCRNPACTAETDCICATPPPVPAVCNETCTSNDDCETGLACSSGSCRNPGCVNETDCECPPVVEDSAMCLDVKVYTVDGDPGNPAATWTKLTTTQLNDLQSGDVVVMAVAGWSSTPTMTNGGFDKAVFSINEVERQEVTNSRPKSSEDSPDTWELYEIYTIPDGITNFSIGAKIHHQTTGWY
jgi:hypothetical protein